MHAIKRRSCFVFLNRAVREFFLVRCRDPLGRRVDTRFEALQPNDTGRRTVLLRRRDGDGLHSLRESNHQFVDQTCEALDTDFVELTAANFGKRRAVDT